MFYFQRHINFLKKWNAITEGKADPVYKICPFPKTKGLEKNLMINLISAIIHKTYSNKLSSIYTLY